MTEATTTLESAPLERTEEGRRLSEVLAELLLEMGGGRPRAFDAATALEGDLGLGSLERVELFSRIEGALERRLPEGTFASARTVGDVAAALAGAPSSATAPAPAPSAPGAAPAGHSAPPPEEARTLVDLLLYRAARDGARPHVVFLDDAGKEEGALTFAELRRGAAAVATGLRERGVPAGGRVAIILPTGPSFFHAFLGVILAGGTPVPLYPPFRADRIAEYIDREVTKLKNCGASAIVCDEKIAPVAGLLRDRVPSVGFVETARRLEATRASEVTARVAAEDLGLIQYSSGSTGDPKGVALSHRNLLSNCRAISKALALTSDEVGICWLPLYHDMGLIGNWMCGLYLGARMVFLSPVTFLTRPERWLQAVHTYRGTVITAPNFAFDLCAKRIKDEALAGLDLSSLRVAINAAEAVRPETLEAFVRRFEPYGFRRGSLISGFGLAENCVAATYPAPGKGARIDAVERIALEKEGRAVVASEGDASALRFVSCGWPLEGVEVRIAPSEGGDDPVPERVQGRILFRGTSATRGYFGRPEATAEVMRAGGWIDSGDLGYLAEGELFISGRRKDLIIRGGRNIHPRDIEEAAERVEGVRRGCVAAFGVPDEKTGTEAVCVVVETRERDAGAGARIEAAVRATVLERTGTPADRIVLAPAGSIPKTSSGKVRRRECRARVLEGRLDAPSRSVALQIAAAALASAPARLAAAVGRVARAAQGAWALGCFGALLPALGAVGLAVGDPARVRSATSALGGLSLWLGGLAPRVIGLDRLPPGPAILASNHQSYLDAMIVTSALPTDLRCVVKAEMLDWPVFGRIVARGGHLPVDRARADAAVDAFARAREALRSGARIILFPEGTFVAEAGLLPFKLGAFRLAVETGAPIVPVAIRGARRALRAETWLPRPGPIEVEVGAPIQPPPAEKGFAAYVELREATAAAIAAMIDEPRVG